MWWLTLCVDLGYVSVRRADKTLFLGLWGVCPESMSIWIAGLSKEDHPAQGRWASSNLLMAWVGEKMDEGKSALCWGWEIWLVSSSDVSAPSS